MKLLKCIRAPEGMENYILMKLMIDGKEEELEHFIKAVKILKFEKDLKMVLK